MMKRIIAALTVLEKQKYEWIAKEHGNVSS